MIKISIYVVGVLWLISLSSCSKLNEFSEEAPEKVPIVIEGLLMPGYFPTVWLSKFSDNTESINDTTYIPVNNAKVSLSYEGKNYYLTLYDSQWGEYTYKGDDLKIVAGETYNLTVDYTDKIVTSETSIPYEVRNISVSVEPLDARSDSAVLNIRWESIDDSYFYLFLKGDTANVSGSYCSYSEYPFADNYFAMDTVGLNPGDTYYIIIYSLTKDYAQYYFGYDPLNQNYSYESNIIDAYGIFTGVNVNYISFVYHDDLDIKLQTQVLPFYILEDIELKLGVNN